MDLEKVVTDEYPFEEAERAFREFSEKCRKDAEGGDPVCRMSPGNSFRAAAEERLKARRQRRSVKAGGT